MATSTEQKHITKLNQNSDERNRLKQANNPTSVKVDVYVIEPRARRQARDGVDVPAQEVHEPGPHGSSHVAHEDLCQRKQQKNKRVNEWYIAPSGVE